jgi:hypothetical protein
MNGSGGRRCEKGSEKGICTGGCCDDGGWYTVGWEDEEEEEEEVEDWWFGLWMSGRGGGRDSMLRDRVPRRGGWSWQSISSVAERR